MSRMASRTAAGEVVLVMIGCCSAKHKYASSWDRYG